MKFMVVPLAGVDTSVPPDQLSLPDIPEFAAVTKARELSLTELDSAVLAGVGPRMSLLGTVVDGPLRWRDPVTENPNLGDVEVWNIHNTTEDAHPIHVHQVQFEIVGRTDADGQNPTVPEVGESGRKDTVVVYPGGVTTVKAQFDVPGRFLWHCHILEHEDNEMMRPYQVEPNLGEPQ
jgi:bilirubin oxidase